MPQHARAIDFNRGVTIRDEPNSHAQVYMYKDEPGVYRNVYGMEVPEALARAAGFPTDELAKEKKYNADLAAASRTLRQQMDAGKTNRKVVKEGSSYNMVQVGKTAYLIETVDGKAMHPGHLSLEVAGVLYRSLEPVVEGPKTMNKSHVKEKLAAEAVAAEEEGQELTEDQKNLLEQGSFDNEEGGKIIRQSGDGPDVDFAVPSDKPTKAEKARAAGVYDPKLADVEVDAAQQAQAQQAREAVEAEEREEAEEQRKAAEKKATTAAKKAAKANK